MSRKATRNILVSCLLFAIPLFLSACADPRVPRHYTFGDCSFPHADGWEDSHGACANDEGYSGCLDCHGVTEAKGDAPTCNSCHPSYPHGAIEDWGINQHGPYVENNAVSECPPAECRLCHGDNLEGGGGKGVSCSSCHNFPHLEGWASGLTHGTQALSSDTLKNIANCKLCHGEALDLSPGGTRACKTGPSSCKDCHATYLPHNSAGLGGPDWGKGTSHGPIALGDMTACQLCHGADYKGGISGVSCYKCHPAYPHPGSWNHGETALADISACKSCHGTGLEQAPPGKQSCKDCHDTYLPHDSAGLGGPDWSDGKVHGPRACDPTPCQLCHGTDYKGGVSGISCYSCHNYPHATGWVAGLIHGTDSMSADPLKNVSNCKICHGTGLDKNPSCATTPNACKDCHETYLPHDSAGLGGPTWLGIHSPSGNNPALLPDCKKCHGDTLDGGISGVSCNNCHATSATCISCHTNPKDNGDGIPVGGRRAVVAEFPTGTDGEHAHHRGTLNNDDCVVCHDQATHKDGQVDLVDPDDAGTLYSFLLKEDLSSDPDLSDFCMHCHDDNGATRLAAPMDPFGNGNTPPDVASKFKGTLQWKEWYGDGCFGSEGTKRGVTSHHDISDADQAFSGAKIECLSCHGTHSPSATKPLMNPFDTSQAWTETTTLFCLQCHSGGTPTDPGMPASVIWPKWESDPTKSALRGIDSCDYVGTPWYVDISWSHSAHGGGSKRSWTGYSGAPAAELDCLVCHDEHGSYSATNTAGNPYMIRDNVDGTSFVDDGVRPVRPWNGPPWNTMGGSREVAIPVSGINVGWGGTKGLCKACHSNWLNAYSWHSLCSGCQTCHGHGQAWNEYDWGGGTDETPWCP